MQVRFAGSHEHVVQDVLAGHVDIGFIRTGILEELVATHGLNLADVKILHDRSGIVDPTGNVFPYRLSSDLFPEWILAVAPDVDYEVERAVMVALLAINSSSLEAHRGQYDAFDPPTSNSIVRNMMLDLGTLVRNENGEITCAQTWSYDALRCPAGSFKIAQEEQEHVCERLFGLDFVCPPGIHCVCRPCRRALETELRALHPDASHTFDVEVECHKMDTCDSTEQGVPVSFVLRDNDAPRRPNATITYVLHQQFARTDVETALKLSSSLYHFNISSVLVGSHLVEVLLDGKHIIQSPFLIQVLPRTCPATKVPNETGHCNCPPSLVLDGDQCVNISTVGVVESGLTVAAIVPIAIGSAVCILAFVYFAYKRALRLRPHNFAAILAQIKQEGLLSGAGEQVIIIVIISCVFIFIINCDAHPSTP